MKKTFPLLLAFILIINFFDAPHVKAITIIERTEDICCSYCGRNSLSGNIHILTFPTCTEPGIGRCSCTHIECQLDTMITLPAKGHEREPYPFTISVATCTKPEYDYDGLFCGNCGTIFKEPTVLKPPLGHDIVIDEAVAPSCTESGLTEGKHCTRCKDETVAQKVIEPTGHDYDCVEKIKSFDYVCHCGDSYSEAKVVGDIDKSGYISINDVTKIQKTSSGYRDFTEFDLIADVDSSGDLTIRDATYIQLYLAKLIDEFPIIIPEE